MSRARARRSIRLATIGAVSAVIVALAASACSLVADLGPEARPRADASAAEVVCGVTGLHQTDPCSNCVDTNCCGETTACGARSRCVEGVECLMLCAFQYDCARACDREYTSPEYDALTACGVERCTLSCLPKPTCNALGRCCVAIPQSDVRRACSIFAATLDEAVCAQRMDEMCGFADAGARDATTD